jgi:hypothetical protein
MMELADACLVDPHTIKPADFDFAPFVEAKKKDAKDVKKRDAKEDKKKDSKKDEDSDKPAHLPRRLKLAAFSKQVGHRPTGLQTAQVKLFVERFPTEFREMSMARMVLPHFEGRPFVAPDGLPCPALSTVNALRVLESQGDAMPAGDPAARSQILKILQHGVQVEWTECRSFLEWQLQAEAAAVQASVAVAPHVVDTAIKFASFLRSPLASSQGQSEAQQHPGAPSSNVAETPVELAIEKDAEARFMAFLQGKSIHRLRDAKALLHTTEPSVLQKLAGWRKAAHYLHANSLAQVYFLGVPEWATLRSKTVDFGKERHSLQHLVAAQTMRIISESEIVNSGEVPKLKKVCMTQTIFKEWPRGVCHALGSLPVAALLPLSRPGGSPRLRLVSQPPASHGFPLPSQCFPMAHK